VDEASIRVRPDLHGLLNETVKQLPSGGRSAAVEPEDKLVEVVVHMLLADGPLMRAQQPAFRQRDDGVDPRQQFAGGLAAAGYHDRLVPIALQAAVGGPSVGPDHAARLDVLRNEGVKDGPGQVRDAAHPNPTDLARPVLLRGHNHEGFGFRQPADNTLFLRPPIGFVHLHGSGQPVPPWPNHRSPQFVQPGPGGLIAAQAQDPLHSQGAYAVLLARDVPHGAKP